MTPEQVVLVAPRHYFASADRFVERSDTAKLLLTLSDKCRWMLRSEAEVSEEWVQPIPVALLANSKGNWCILRRTKETRFDLEAKLTLVLGGHVDADNGTVDLSRLLTETLLRELQEEVGVTSDREPKLLGLIVDNSSLLSSRHVALVFVVVTEQEVRSQAPEEFAKRSRYSGRFLPTSELMALHGQFDPWSNVLIEDFLAPQVGLRLSRQPRLPLPLRE